MLPSRDWILDFGNMKMKVKEAPTSELRLPLQSKVNANRDGGYIFPSERITVNLAPARSTRRGREQNAELSRAIFFHAGLLPMFLLFMCRPPERIDLPKIVCRSKRNLAWSLKETFVLTGGCGVFKQCHEE